MRLTTVKEIKKVSEIKALIYAHGDPSVGMFGFSLEMNIKGFDMKDDIITDRENGREEFRKSITEFFTTWLDYGRVDVHFSDECPDCFKTNCNRKCTGGF